MSTSIGFSEVVAGGFGALLGPGLALSSMVVAVAGLAFGAHRSRPGQLVTALVLALVFGAATARRGLASTEGPTTAAIVSLAILLALSWIVVRREEGRVPWFGALSGLLLATLAVQWRADAYGPVLGALRGPWQQAPDFGSLFVYHVATGLALGGLYLVASEGGRRLPRRAGIGLWWALSLVCGALLWTSHWPALGQQLLLRWPVVLLG